MYRPSLHLSMIAPVTAQYIRGLCYVWCAVMSCRRSSGVYILPKELQRNGDGNYEYHGECPQVSTCSVYYAAAQQKLVYLPLEGEVSEVFESNRLVHMGAREKILLQIGTVISAKGTQNEFVLAVAHR